MFAVRNNGTVQQTVHFGERSVRVGAGGLSAPLPDQYRTFFSEQPWAEIVILEESIGKIEVTPPKTKRKSRKKRSK